MIIREVKVEEAENLATLIREVDENSEYMLWEKGERSPTANSQLKMIESLRKSGNSAILVAETENKLVGYLLAIGGKARRNKHVVYIVIGVAENHRGRGVGSRLFKELDNWASENDIHRLELTVVTKNEGGLHLYKKAGFQIEGTKRKSLYINGEFVDEFYMSKLM